MQEVGWPEPAAVVDIAERMLRRRAFSLISFTVAAEGPAGEVTLMRMSPYSARKARLDRGRILHGLGGQGERVSEAPQQVAGALRPRHLLQDGRSRRSGNAARRVVHAATAAPISVRTFWPRHGPPLLLMCDVQIRHICFRLARCDQERKQLLT